VRPNLQCTFRCTHTFGNTCECVRWGGRVWVPQNLRRHDSHIVLRNMKIVTPPATLRNHSLIEPHRGECYRSSFNAYLSNLLTSCIKSWSGERPFHLLAVIGSYHKQIAIDACLEDQIWIGFPSWVFSLRKRRPRPHRSLQIKNRLLKAVFFRPQFSFAAVLHQSRQRPTTTSSRDWLRRKSPLPYASPIRKTLATSCEDLAPAPSRAPDYPSKNRRKRFP